MNFEGRVQTIAGLHHRFQVETLRAVNAGLTMRNWMIGLFVKEYEQNGEDRAKYGRRILQNLSQRLCEEARLSYHPRELRRCRQFYEAYPQIGGTLSPKSQTLLPDRIFSEIRESVSPELQVLPDRLIASLSFSHLAELLEIAQPLKRAFYEIECIRGGWSVRELMRQIASLYYERSGLSRNKKKLAEMVRRAAEPADSALAIRDCRYERRLSPRFSISTLTRFLPARKVKTKRSGRGRFARVLPWNVPFW